MAHNLLQSYFRDLDALRMVGADTENQLRPAFERLLADYARARNLVFVPEAPMKAVNGKHTIRPDGVVKGLNRMDWGYWEAKDEKDDLNEEIRAKIAKGYPTDNIIFDDTRKAVLYQAGVRVLEIEMSDKEALQTLLERFFTFERPEYTAFREALEAFHADVPPIVAELRELLAKTARENADFVRSREEFLKVCQASINTDVSMDDVNEMLLQHILTEDIFTTIFEDAEFHHANNIARELVSVLDTFFRGAVKRNVLARIRPYYEAIRAAAVRIADYREKQTFLKAVYEDFYKAYNPKAADRLGVVYTPHEIVRFMIHATDELLHTHFGKDLLASGVDILDPATGTGTFICDLLEYFPTSRKEQIRHKYLHELHANEVSILPYYIANLNIEYVFQQKTGEYCEFPNLCFVDTLDNTGFGFAGQQGDMFGSLSAENAARVKRQNERNIAVIIGNPPYNANQQNENDNNKNRTYREVDKRIKDTYIAASTAQKTKLYDMYARFFRWASDRLAANGIVAFVCNRSFIESRTFDGFRKCVAEEFSDIYIVDTRSDVRANPRIAGTTHNVFGIQTGVAVVFLVRKGIHKETQSFAPLTKGERGITTLTSNPPRTEDAPPPLSKRQKKGVLPPALARIHYFTLADEQTRKEKLEWFATTAFADIPFERITPDDRHTWLNQTDNDFDTLLPLCSKDVKSGKAKTGAVFELFSLGISTNRDEWVIDYTPEALAKKMKFFADFYNNYKHTSEEYDTTIKWSEQLKRNHSNGVKEPFDDGCIVPVAYRPFSTFQMYFSDTFIDRAGQAKEMFEGENQVIAFRSGDRMDFLCNATNNIPNLNYYSLDPIQCLPLYRYENGERRENITDWGLKQFRARYGKSVEREDIFHYVYAVLHCPRYRRKYEQNLKRDFPRVPFYADFQQWVSWGKELMRLHVEYETAEPFLLEREDKPVRAGTPLPLKSKLKADKAKGEIIVDESTTLSGVPPEAWEYRLGNRSALEWVCDQYRDYTPSDPTIREKFHTYRFADYKERVITLLQQVCRVSIETMRIIREMEKEGAKEG
jgi:predicted helicase